MASLKQLDLIKATEFKDSVENIRNLGFYNEGPIHPFGITHVPIGIKFEQNGIETNIFLFNCDSYEFVDRYNGQNEKYPINTQYNLHNSKFVELVASSKENNKRENSIASSIMRNLTTYNSRNIVCCYKVSNIQYDCFVNFVSRLKMTDKIEIYRTELREYDENNHSGMIIYRKDQFNEVEFSRDVIGFGAKKYYFAQKICLYPSGCDIFDAICFVNTHMPINSKNEFIHFINKIHDYPIVFAGNLNHPSKKQASIEVNTIEVFQDTKLAFFRPTKFTGLNIMQNVLDDDELAMMNHIIEKQKKDKILTDKEIEFEKDIFRKQLDVFDVFGVAFEIKT